MSVFKPETPRMTITLRVLARLLGYPDDALREHLHEASAALHAERALGPGRLAEIDALSERLRAAQPLDAEAAYVELFDRGRSTALHLFEHVHGDSRDRGPAMVDLVKTYEQAGLLLAPGELPDHLSVVLEYASTQPAAQAREFLREIAHIVQAIFSALLARESGYASVLAAVLDLAGVAAAPVALAAEPALDDSWSEPPAFDGCSTEGQAAPGQPQPIHLVKRPAAAQPGARP
ncbi:MAG TPA: nitrate reductase molybdenum cofactor assembly chaperone [Burkholderiaceae bacterium]|nr:nitrate reductase molybdenum cofactor assembly chaperone [Burkholderiaceae bacterium]